MNDETKGRTGKIGKIVKMLVVSMGYTTAHFNDFTSNGCDSCNILKSLMNYDIR